MAKNKNIVLISFLALGAASAGATDVWWNNSNPLSDVLNSSASSYQVASTGTTQSWWNTTAITASPAVSGGGSSWTGGKLGKPGF